MATGVYKRGDYQYQAKVRVKGHPHVEKTFDTLRDAASWRTEALRKIKRGEIDDLNPVTQKITVSDAADSYRAKVLATLARQGKSTGDVHLRRIEAAFGPLFVSALRAPGINSWVDELATKHKLGPQSIIHHLNTFSGLIQHAHKVKGVHIPAGNPVNLVTRPGTAPSRDRVLLDGEFELLVRAARDTGDGPGMQAGTMLEPMIRLALATSMRQGELLALKRDWIDLKTNVIHLPANATKNGHSRSVALSSEAVAVIGSVPLHISGRVFGCWKDASSFSKPWQRLLRRGKRNYADDCKINSLKPDPRADAVSGDLERFITEDVLESVQVITYTLVGASNRNIRHLTFETVFIDEAAQALEPYDQAEHEQDLLTIGIIAPYRAQINCLKDAIEENDDLNGLLQHRMLSVGTVDSFQGQERDIIAISLTRSNNHGEIGFLSDIRRMNVGMTRARRKLLLVGDSSMLCSNPFLMDLLAYVKRIGRYRTPWEIADYAGLG